METFLGIGLTCIGSIADAVGFVVQKKGHNRVIEKVLYVMRLNARQYLRVFVFAAITATNGLYIGSE